MTIASTNNKITYNGNGIATSFSYTFVLPLKSDATEDGSVVNVYLTNATGVVSKLTSDYWVDVANDRVLYPGYETGTEPAVELQPPVLPAGWKITLLRSVPLTQEMDLTNGGPFLAEVIESAHDKAMMAIQQLYEQIDRSVQLPVDSPAGSGEALLATVQGYSVSAATSAGTATAQAGIATTKAGEASASASSASASAGTATTKAGEAAQSAIDADASADLAIAAEGTATTKAGEAAQSAIDAASAKDTAVSAKDTAVSAAGTATTKAGEASGSAIAADSSADAAAISEGNASGYADDAEQSAIAAAQSAASIDPSLLVHNSIFDANSIVKADSDNTPVALTVDASTVVGRDSTGGIVALTMTALKTLLSLGTMAYETATNYVAKSLYDANTILYATTDNTPVALTVAEQRIVGRVTGGAIDDLTADQVDTIVGFSPSVRQTVLKGASPNYILTADTNRYNNVGDISIGYLCTQGLGNGYAYELTTTGTTAASVGTGWPTTVGQTKTDGTAVWTCRSLLSCMIYALPSNPLIITFADGFSSVTGKPVDYTVVLTRCYTVTGITANAIRCVMARFNKNTGLLADIIASEGIPTYGSPLSAAPSDSALGFNYLTFKQQVWGGSSWADYTYPTVYLGEVTTNASAVTAAVPYAPLGRYDSGLFEVAANTAYGKSDNLGCPGIVNVTNADDTAGTNERPAIMGTTTGWFPTACTRNLTTVKTGATNVGLDNAGSVATTGNFRVRKQRCF